MIELLMVVAIIGILVAVAIPSYSNVQSRARIAKAQADVHPRLGGGQHVRRPAVRPRRGGM